MCTATPDFLNSEWLVFKKGIEANLTRTVFNTLNVNKAELSIIALGYFEAYINGKSVTDDKLIPAMSNYEPRDLSVVHMPIFDTMQSRIYSRDFDISKLIEDGKNVLAVHIGAGWYGQSQSKNEGIPKWGENTLVFTITLTDKNGKTEKIVSSPNNTKWNESYIRETSLYFGEYHNCRYYEPGWNTTLFDDSSWFIPTVRKAPDAKICKSDFPSDKVVKSLDKTIVSTFGDRTIYDIGELASGYAVIKFNKEANENDTACVRYADELKSDGSLEFHYCGGEDRMQKDFFLVTDSTKDKEFYPHFTWHAARYIEVTGRASLVRYDAVYTDITQTGFFESNNDTLNWIFDAYIKTQKSNIHGCVPSDCPHRERLGYTGDGELTCGAVMSAFDARRLYIKWLRDVRDCQDMTTGHVQNTSPFYGGGGGPGGWGGAAVIVPWRYYEFYGDKKMLEDSYSSMKAYIKYMLNHTEDGIVTHAEKGGWCLGDWCPINNNIIISPAFVNTYFLVKTATYTAKTAALLNKKNDESYYLSVAKDAKKAIIMHFYNKNTGSFCNGEQGADAFAVDIELGDERTLNNLVKKYSELKTFDTGIFGTDLVIKMLFKHSYASVAFELLTNKKVTSFYNMKKHGATTLWENWDGCDSRCHPMFGAVTEYFFSEILGIKRANNNPTYKEITVSPAYIEKLKFVKGTMNTPQGKISVEVTNKPNGKQDVKVITDDSIKVIK